MIGTILITGAGADDNGKRAAERDKGVIFKNCAPFIDYISEIKKYSNRWCKRYSCCDANVEFNRIQW